MMQGPNLTDSGQFAGEPVRTGLGRELKMKIALGAGILVFALAGAAYVRHRLAAVGWGAQSANAAQSSDALGQRKTKVFEAESSPSPKPPILLPLEGPPARTVSASLPAGFGTGLPHGTLNEGLPAPAPPAAPPAMKPMMLGDGGFPASTLPGATLPLPRSGDPLASIGTTDTSALAAFGFPVPDNERGKTNADTGKGLAARAIAHNTPGSSDKGSTQTVETQALIAREKAGAQVTGTAQVSASKLGRRSFVLAKGAFIPCVLETQMVSNVFGMASCVVTQNVYSDDGKVLLIERGSKVTGNYGSNLRNGDSRLAVVWDRIKTPKGITVDVNSPATDGVGAMGMPGVVDKHWFERIAGALLLSLVQDTIQYATSSIAYRSYLKEQKENATTQLPVQMANTSNSTITTTSIDPVTGDTITTVTQSGQSPVAQAARNGNNNPPPVPVFGGTNTAKQGASIPEQVLAASINATSTLYKNRGEIVYIFVANDVWFDRVYGLKE
jgi:type IV secretion system protein VirB10